jgi:GT2 family glycosyltransferase
MLNAEGVFTSTFNILHSIFIISLSMGIAIVIITYNRPDDALELAQNISQLQQVTTLCSEVIFVNNRSTVSYSAVESFIEQHPHIPFRYFKTEENLGVSRGRNFAIQQSTAPYLVFLDDDALFKNLDALQYIPQIFNERQETNQPTGIISFKVYYHSTGELQKTAFAHKQFDRRKDWHHFETGYFVGCAHAIHRDVFDRTGYYPTNFFYGMEEYDLSYRAIDAGFDIVYDDRVVILHKESPLGRLPNKDKLRGMWVNKCKVAFKYLPLVYFFSTAILWSFEYLGRSGYNLSGWLKGWTEVFRIPATEKRRPINKKGLTYLKNVEARLWY